MNHVCVGDLAIRMRTGPFGSQLLHSEFVDSGVAVIGIDNVVKNTFAWAQPRFISLEKYSELSRFTVQPGDVLITIMGTCGRSAVVPEGVPTSITSKHLCAITLDPNRCLANYLHACLKQPDVQRQLVQREKGAIMPGLNMQMIKELRIPLPILSEQRRIADILDRAEALRAKRRAALAQLSELPRAVYSQMFDSSFEQRPLVSVCSSADDIRCGPFGTQLNKDEFQQVGVPLWGIKQVNADFTIQTREFVSELTARRLIQYSIEPGDLVMTRKGTIGNCAVYPANWPLGIMHSDLLRIRTNADSCLPLFLTSQLRYSPEVQRQITGVTTGAIMPGINVTKLKQLAVVVPPLPLQQEFARRVQAIDRLKAKHRQSLAEMDALFASLQHRAFRGEL